MHRHGKEGGHRQTRYPPHPATLCRVPDYAGRVEVGADWRGFGEYFPGIVGRCFPESLVWKENTDEAGFQRARTLQTGRALGSVLRFLRGRDAWQGLRPAYERSPDPFDRRFWLLVGQTSNPGAGDYRRVVSAVPSQGMRASTSDQKRSIRFAPT